MTVKLPEKVVPPVKIMEVLHATWANQALQTGVDLNVFACLQDKALTAPEVAEKLSVPVRGLDMFLATTDGCVFTEREVKDILREAGFAEGHRLAQEAAGSPVMIARTA